MKFEDPGELGNLAYLLITLGLAVLVMNAVGSVLGLTGTLGFVIGLACFGAVFLAMMVVYNRIFEFEASGAAGS